MEKKLSKEEVKGLFVEPEEILGRLEKKCPVMARERKRVFKDVKRSICKAAIDLNEKAAIFKKIRVYVEVSRDMYPAEADEFDRLDELIDAGEKVRGCGGP